MFKRVEKRRLKREEEEALGLDENMKEILGMHDTDSEESASESDDSEDEQDDGGEDEGEGSGLEMMEGDEDMDPDDDEQGSEDEGEDEEDPDVSVKQALEDPIYVVSVMPEVKACIICPGKVLKGVKMVQLHRTSNAHERRAKQFNALAADADPNESAWGVLQRNAQNKPTLSMAPSSSGDSKRAQKKKAHSERQRQRREKQKLKRIEAAKTKKTEAAAGAASSSSTPANVSTSTPEKSKPKPGKSKSAKAKAKDGHRKDHRPDDTKDSDHLDSLSPPKKKRKVIKVAEGEVHTGDRDNVRIEPSAPSAADPVTQKREKRGKGRPRVASVTQAATVMPPTVTKKQDAVDSVNNIVRSTSDRAKNARARALSAAAKGSSKDATKNRKKVFVS